MDDLDLDIDLKATVHNPAPPTRAAPKAPDPALGLMLTPLPADLFSPLPPPPSGPRDAPDREPPTVTEATFLPEPTGPIDDAGAHSKLTPLPPSVLPPAPPAERRPRADVPLPRLRETIRSADEVERARGERERGGSPLLTVVGVLAIAGFVAAVPVVVWLALNQQPEARATAAPQPTEQELMGIPVRRDLKLPKE